MKATNLTPRAFSVAATILSVSLSGCVIPDAMHVRQGGEPAWEDDHVLFRTTYYFRVADFCGDTANNHKPVQIDSLYRFRMTGKGKSTFNRVRFESGTLQDWQIDPFGASVEFDRESGKPYFVSQQKRESSLRQHKHYAEIDRLRALGDKLGCKATGGKTPDSGQAEQCTIINDKIAENLRLIGPGDTGNLGYAKAKAEAVRALEEYAMSLAASVKTGDKTLSSALDNLNKARTVVNNASNTLELLVALDQAKEALSAPAQRIDKATQARLDAARKLLLSENTPDTLNSSATGLVCGDGLPARRGFQILGPEGWRTFDQDERLVLAMSSNGKPLLDTLRDLSSRAMAQKSAELSREALLSESLATARARTKLSVLGSTQPEALSTALDAITAAFDKKEGE